MTEAEWLNCTNPGTMLESLWRQSSQRKLRLFAHHCLIRQVWHLLDERGREASMLAERLADGDIPPQEWERVTASIDTAFHTTHEKAAKAATKAASMSIWSRAYVVRIARHIRDALCQPARGDALQDQVLLLRDLFTLQGASIHPSWLTWNDGTVRKIAQSIYDERAFERMPILADALEDAGCDNADILTHCRSGGEHVRGCWVVDLLLGKS